jgi:1-acylglycerone phosphate reductase
MIARDTRQTVLITGCSEGGIGESLAKEFNSRNFRVFATARDAKNIEHLTKLGIETLSLEVHKPESIQRLKNQVRELTGGRLDYLVNNAGKNYTVPGKYTTWSIDTHTCPLW